MPRRREHLARIAASLQARLRLEQSLGRHRLSVGGLDDTWSLQIPATREAEEPRAADRTVRGPTPDSPPPAPATAATAAVPDPTTRPPAGSVTAPTAPAHESADAEYGTADRLSLLTPLREDALGCTKCALCERRTTVVWGEGSLDTDLVFVGDIPGREEDEQGLPLQGRAGRLLNRMIEGVFARDRRSVYVCTVVKCRPPGNREPTPEEVLACLPYLQRQIETIRPRAIVALGAFAAGALTGQPGSIDSLHGRWFEFHGVPVMPIHHPVELLRLRDSLGGRSPADRATFEDLKKVRDLLNRPL